MYIASSAAGRCWKSSFAVDSFWVSLKRFNYLASMDSVTLSPAMQSCAEMSCVESRAADSSQTYDVASRRFVQKQLVNLISIANDDHFIFG